LPVLITEGALKAEAFVALRPPMRAIATAGVGVGHAQLVAATGAKKINSSAARACHEIFSVFIPIF